MTLRDFLGVLRRSWLLIVATTIGCSIAAVGLTLQTAPSYQTQAQLFVSVETTGDVSGALTGGMYLQQRLQSYITLVDTPAVLDPVIDQLNLDTNHSQLASQISATNPPDTVLINVLATDGAAQPASDIANATAESLAAEIVRLETTVSGATPVQAELIRTAEVPGAPSSPRLEFNLVLGILLGLLIGVGVTILRAAPDTSIKSIEELQNTTGSTLLGTVAAFGSGAKRNPLITMKGAWWAEAYRSIRTNLKYVNVDNPPRCVVLTSSMPLEGKSTTAVNLAIALAQGGSKVLLVEADLRRPKAAEYLGVDGSIGLTDVLIGQARCRRGDHLVAAGFAGLPAFRGDSAEPQRATGLPATCRPARRTWRPVRRCDSGCPSPPAGH